MRILKVNSTFTSAHQNMMGAVVLFALNSSNIAITSSIEAFLTVINLLQSNLEVIQKLQATVNNPVTGIAQSKKLMRRSLEMTSASIMQSVFSYAVSNNDYELMAKMKVTPNGLQKLKDNTLYATMLGAIKTISPLTDDLKAFNITDKLLDGWSEQATAFSDIMSAPKVAHANVDAIRNSIQDCLRASMNLLYNQADTIAQQYKNNATTLSYFRGYQKARKLQPLTKHTKLQAAVTDYDGKPVSHVRITQDGTTNSIVTDLSGKGCLYILIPKEQADIAPEATYSFTLTKDGQRVETGNLVIRKGKSVTKKFIVPRQEFILPEHKPLVGAYETVE